MTENQKSKIREYQREYYAKNWKHIRAQQKEYRENNPEKIKNCRKKYYEKYFKAEPKLISYNGQTKTSREWAKEKGLNLNTFLSRLNLGWNIERALNSPTKKKLITYDNQTNSISQWAKIAGFNIQTFRTRLKSGWSIEKTITTPIRKQNKRKAATANWVNL